MLTRRLPAAVLIEHVRLPASQPQPIAEHGVTRHLLELQRWLHVGQHLDHLGHERGCRCRRSSPDRDAPTAPSVGFGVIYGGASACTLGGSSCWFALPRHEGPQDVWPSPLSQKAHPSEVAYQDGLNCRFIVWQHPWHQVSRLKFRCRSHPYQLRVGHRSWLEEEPRHSVRSRRGQTRRL